MHQNALTVEKPNPIQMRSIYINKIATEIDMILFGKLSQNMSWCKSQHCQVTILDDFAGVVTQTVVIRCLDLLVKKSIFIDKSRKHDFVESRIGSL